MASQKPMVPTPIISIIALVDIGGMIYLGALQYWIGVAACVLVIVIILGGDVSAMFRAYRGIPPDPPDKEVTR